MPKSGVLPICGVILQLLLDGASYLIRRPDQSIMIPEPCIQEGPLHLLGVVDH